MTIDFTKLTDEELDAEISNALNERERRRSLADAPTQLEAIAQRYINGGGDPAALQAAFDRGKKKK